MYPIPFIVLIVTIFSLAGATIIVLSLISVYRLDQSTSNRCQISFAPMISLPTDVGPNAVKVADFNNDTYLDIAVVNYNASTTNIWLGNGNGSFHNHLNFSNDPNGGTSGIAIADVNKDNQPDIIVSNRNASNIKIFLGQGNGNFSQGITLSTGTNSTPIGLALGYLNNDTNLDLVVTNRENDSLLIFAGMGNGSFIHIQSISTGNKSGPYLVIIRDFNRDNYLDIAVGNGDPGGNYVGVYFGNGTGQFSISASYFSNNGPYALIADDFNRDRMLDIATANYDGYDVTILLGKRDGTFQQNNSFSTGNGSFPYAIASGDFNRDNIPDLIVSNSGTDNIGILLGYGNGNFRAQQTFFTGNGSRPVELAIGDLNRDNRLDFISVNRNNDTIGIFLSTCS